MIFTGCTQNTDKGNSATGQPIGMEYAKNIRIDSLDSNNLLVTLRNPWDSTRTIATYLLNRRGAQIPAEIANSVKVIKVPLKRDVVYSGVHGSLLQELGCENTIVGMCDISYLSDSILLQAVKERKIADCGLSSNPNLEKIISLKPDAVMHSPFEGSDEMSKLTRYGLTSILTADYLERTPLGRAEWIRFYGRLFDKGEKADSIFRQIISGYESLKNKVKDSENKPVVLFDMPYADIWSVPTSGSATGSLIEDAGGINPFASYSQAGSAQLSKEKVLYIAQNSDIWLIRNVGISNLTLMGLRKENPIYTKFKAFRTGNVYKCDTSKYPLFEEGAFHPEKTLEEMIKLLYPDGPGISSGLKYYRKL